LVLFFKKEHLSFLYCQCIIAAQGGGIHEGAHQNHGLRDGFRIFCPGRLAGAGDAFAGGMPGAGE
jgi:hypothetical protein